jgi:hypothetical protein
MPAMAINIILAVVFLAAAGVLLSPRLLASPAWRATVTPLASIIGSGFLISLPILAADLGAYAIVGMALLVATGYLIGAAVRFNIAHGEALYADGKFPIAGTLERLSHLTLAFAYFISVTYYLTLLAAFLLKGVGNIDPHIAKLVTSALLVFICGYGFLRGLHALEGIEEYAVGLKLAIIVALLAALAWFNFHLAVEGEWRITASEARPSWHSAQIVLGLLIVVQGFETSRYLRGVYPPALRIRTMRNAQLLSGAIYIIYFALAAVTLTPHVSDTSVAAIVDIMAVVASVVPLMLTFGAVFAQLSAAVADAIGGAGLIYEFTRKRIDRRHAYPVIAVCGLGLTWATDPFAIVALASKAFALFYMFQCLIAAVLALRVPAIRHRLPLVAGFVLLAAMSLAVVIFGISAEPE